jgi:predicted  nucleic acid-binding Zn-ribbon protein
MVKQSPQAAHRLATGGKVMRLIVEQMEKIVQDRLAVIDIMDDYDYDNAYEELQTLDKLVIALDEAKKYLTKYE